MSRGFQCQLCGGEVIGGTYTHGACAKCGAKYEYDEGYRLADEEIAKLVSAIASERERCARIAEAQAPHPASVNCGCGECVGAHGAAKAIRLPG